MRRLTYCKEVATTGRPRGVETNLDTARKSARATLGQSQGAPGRCKTRIGGNGAARGGFGIGITVQTNPCQCQVGDGPDGARIQSHCLLKLGGGLVIGTLLNLQ